MRGMPLPAADLPETGPDLADPALAADPYPLLARLRGSGPVHRSRGDGPWLAVTHAACDEVLRHRGMGRIWRDREPVEEFRSFNLLHRTSILENEPPTHTRLRRLVAGAFGRGHVERMRPEVTEVAAGLVAGLVERAAAAGSADLVTLVAEPLPVEVIARLLGVPPADRPLLRPWSNAIVKMYEYGTDAPARAAAEDASREFVAYLRDLVAARRLAPGDDLVSDLVAASDEGDRLTPDEVVGTCVLLLMAGHEATANVVANGTAALLDHPDQWRAVVADPDLVVPAVEEMVRFDTPLQLFERTAVRDVVVAGTPVAAGERVAALLGAANRDPAVFADPDRFDVTRRPGAHLGFGAGIHFCLGAPLARLEVQAVLGELRSRTPGLVAAGEARRRPEFVIRGMAELPVAVG